MMGSPVLLNENVEEEKDMGADINEFDDREEVKKRAKNASEKMSDMQKVLTAKTHKN